VTSRETSLRQLSADRLTSSTAPTVSEARNVMMPTTATSARPDIELRGTMGDSKRGGAPAFRGAAVNSAIPSSLIRSLIDVQAAFVQHQAARVVLVHQRDIVGRNHDGGAGLVQLDEQ